MKTRASILNICFWLPLVCCAQGNISVTIQQPSPNAIVGNQLFVEAAITSAYELQNVAAVVDGQSSNLVFSSAQGAWTNTFSLTGATRGPTTLTIAAADVFGNSTQAQTVVFKDLPPTITVTEPRTGTVALPQLQITASASDDDPVGAKIYVYAGGGLLVAGTNSINTVASISGNDGQPVSLRFDAVDSVGQTSSVWRTVYVLASTNWTEVARVGGPILDVSSTTILFVDGNALTTLSRASGAETVLLDQPDITPNEGALTPIGAIFASASTMYGLEDGVLTNLGTGQYPQVQGNSAIWVTGISLQGLMLRDLFVRTNRVVSTLADNVTFAPNGDIIFVTENPKYNPNILIRYRQGATSVLANGYPNFTYDIVASDGTNVVYDERPYPPYSGITVLLTTTSETFLATNSFPSMAATAGWVAFAKPDNSGVAQIWTISPTGAFQQQTFFGTLSRVQALAPNGQLIFLNGGHLFLARNAELPLDLGAWNFGGAASVFWQQGRWYARLGRSLFAVSSQPGIALSLLSNGKLSLLLRADAGDTLVTQASTNLIDWWNFATNLLTSNTVEVLDPVNVALPRKFYRAFMR